MARHSEKKHDLPPLTPISSGSKVFRCGIAAKGRAIASFLMTEMLEKQQFCGFVIP